MGHPLARNGAALAPFRANGAHPSCTARFAHAYMYYLAPKISRQDQVVEKKEARMARRGSPEIFSDQGSPVLPVQSAKSFYGTGRKSKNLKATNSTTASTSGSQLRKNKSPGSILSAKTRTGKQSAEPQSRAEKQSGPTEPPRNELPRWCYESQYQYHSSSQSQEENLSGTHSDEEEESVPQSQMEMFSKRKRRLTQKEQQSAEHSSMEENIRDMKCTLKLLYEKVEANEKSLKELKAR